MNKTVLLIAGFVTTIIGMTLVLRCWSSAVIVFQGIVPTVVAVAGLVLMFAASFKK